MKTHSSYKKFPQSLAVTALVFLGTVAYILISNVSPSAEKIFTNNLDHRAFEKSATTTASLYPFVRVVDGDTIVVSDNGVKRKVRFIGINAPESVDPRRPVQCFGKEASTHMKELLAGQSSVNLEFDDSQGRFDKYGRWLAYVFRMDGVNLNERQIADGYAYEYTYHVPYKYQAEFKAAERKARDDERGLWSPQTCNGKY